MNLKEVFDQLSYGELSQLSIGGQPAGEIGAANWVQVVSHINLGLSALYKRFSLKEGRVVITLVPGQSRYKLHSDYSVNNVLLPLETKYIQDTVAQPFQDDVLKVEQVWTDGVHSSTEEPVEMPLNSATDRYSIFTPSALVMQVHDEVVAGAGDYLPDRFKTATLEIVYRASHPKLSVPPGFFNPEVIELELPDAFLEPLLYYVASRVNNPIGMSNEFHAGSSYAAKYEHACQWLEAQNLEVDQGQQSIQLDRKGWV